MLGDLQDVTLGFGKMKMIPGRAFTVDGASGWSAHVAKQWVEVGTRRFLVERVNWKAIQPVLRDLPLPKAQASTKSPAIGEQVCVNNNQSILIPAFTRGTASVAKASIQMASLEPTLKGLVIDYSLVTVNTLNLLADQTYYVSAPVVVDNLTVEGNTVVKYDVGASIEVAPGGTIITKTGPYREAVFTSVDDNTCGETISGNPLSGYYANPAFILHDAVHNVRYVRVAYAEQVFSLDDGYVILEHSQIANCGQVMVQTASSWLGYFNNVLLTDIDSVLSSSGAAHVTAQHITVDRCNVFNDSSSSSTLTVVNSVIANLTSWGAGTLTQDSVSSATDTDFETAIGGAHYLAANSSIRNSASGTIDNSLRTELQTKTTCPPVVYADVSFDTDTTFVPVACRDTAVQDPGFHYEVLDYAFGGVDGNANLTFASGVAAGWFRTSSGWYHAGHGIHMADQKILTFNGSAQTPNYWVRCNVVQEGGTGIGEGGYGPGGITGWADQSLENVSLSPEVRARFTRFSTLAGEGGSHARDDWGYLIVRATDCEFYSGSIGGYVISCYFTNCLFDRMYCAQVAGLPGNEFYWRNCTWQGSRLDLDRWYTSPAMPVSIKDCAFDETVFNLDSYGNTDFDYNAFLTGGSRLTPNGANDTLVSSFDWQVGSLGYFYLPLSSPLIGAGSHSAADAGLYHHTVKTSNLKEGEDNIPPGTVDIGFHHLAVDTNTIPLDIDADGLADYQEDKDGDGIVSAGETSYLLADTDGDKLPDFYELELGYDPLSPDTGNTGVVDGDKDYDGDSLSNAGEINVYASNPKVAKSLNGAVNDGYYKFAALAGLPGSTEVTLALTVLGGGNLRLTLSGAPSGSTYEIYRCTSLSGPTLWDGPWSHYLSGTPGQTVWNFSDTSLIAFFMAGSAADTDGDGLSDGYEVLVSHTIVDNPDSDGDGSPDGWEVQVGSNPNVKQLPQGIYETAVLGDPNTTADNPTLWFKLDNSLADASGTVNLSATGGGYTNDSFFNINAARWFNGTTHRLLLTTSDDPIGGGTSDSVQQGSFSLLFRALSGQASSSREHCLISQGDINAMNGNEIAACFTTSGDLKLRVGPAEDVILNHYDASSGVADDAVVYGAWYYLAVTCDETLGNNEVHWYLGRVGSQTLRSGALTLGTAKKFGNNGNITVGNDEPTGTGFDNGYSDPGRGLVDQVAFWRRELTSSEVAAHFNAVSPSSIPPSFLSGTPGFFYWELMLPITGLHELEDDNPATPTNPSTLPPYEISTGWMNSGFKYVDPADYVPKYFYRKGDKLVFETPWNGAVKPTSPRCELRETKADGDKHNWHPSGTHTLEATCFINAAGGGNSRKVIIGQIHGESPDVPTFTVNYNFPAAKQVSLTYKFNPNGSGTPSDANLILAENVNINDFIHYKVQLTDDGTTVKIHAEAYDVNGVSQTALNQRERTLTPASSWQGATFYFKAGSYYPNDYPETNPITGTAKVTFSSLSATHE